MLALNEAQGGLLLDYIVEDLTSAGIVKVDLLLVQRRETLA